MEWVVELILLVPLSAFFTGLGIYAWRRKKPMWFWSGSTVSEDEISDIPAYNRANGIMWIAYSLVFWTAAALSVCRTEASGVVAAAGSLGGIPVLILVYKRIYAKYKARK